MRAWGFVLCVMLSACINEINEEGDLQNKSGDDWEVELHIEDKFGQSVDAFSQGEAVHMQLSLKNNAASERTLNFSSSQQYDLEVRDAEGEQVWRWSDDRAFLQMLTELSLAPNQTHKVEEVWDQSSSSGAAVPPGRYTVKGYFLGVDEKPAETLTIR